MRYIILPITLSIILLCSCAPDGGKIKNSSEYKTQTPNNTTPNNIPSADTGKQQSKDQETASNGSEKEPMTLVGMAETKLYDKTKNRINNIKLACDMLKDYVVEPGSKFSFNEVVGPRTKQRGYKKAPIIAHGEKEDAYGGGICQVSTTLYQAANSCGLKIIERNSHEKKINYADEGNDAAVSYGTMDMVFVNNTDAQIVLNVSVSKNSVTAKIYRKNIMN